MWVYRLGLQRAKEMLLTGKLIDGSTAEKWGLITSAYDTREELDQNVENFIQDLAKIPSNQLAIQKMVINQAYENMGLKTTQMLATLMDGITRHTPEGFAFKKRAEEIGFKAAVKERDYDPELLLQNVRSKL
jgi:enoyl-CoA hydratase